MFSDRQRTVLITGCSSGIGAALANEFHRRNHRVLATARRMESLQDLQKDSIRTFQLDITDQENIDSLTKTLRNEIGAVDILINNAGYSQNGAVFDLESEDLRRQFETNVIGHVAISRAILPMLRQSHGGCIVNIGSLAGLVPTPFAGAYCASKAALHAITEVMRMELAPLGVQLVSVQPGGVVSNSGKVAANRIRLPKADSPYWPVSKYVLRRATVSQNGALPADVFAHRLADHLLKKNIGPIFRAGTLSTKLPLLKWVLPVKVLDRKLQRLFGLDKLSQQN
jgi:short-subunit dehydrogenase